MKNEERTYVGGRHVVAVQSPSGMRWATWKERISVWKVRAKQRKEASTWVRKGLKKHGRAQVRCKGICLVRQPNTGYWKHNCNEKDSNLVWHGMESLSGGFRAPAEEGGFSMQSY